MEVKLALPEDLDEKLGNIITAKVQEAFNSMKEKIIAPEWMSLKEGATYAGTSPATFRKWCNDFGLETVQVMGYKRVSKTSIDEFLNRHIKI